MVEETNDPGELLGDSIKKLSQGIRALKKTGVNEKCIIDLLYLQTKIARKTIVLIFDSLEDLAKVYCEGGE